MATKTVNILCVNNQSLSQRMEISEQDSLKTLKSKLQLKEARFVYGGREVLENEDLFKLVLEGTTIHLVTTGVGNNVAAESGKSHSNAGQEPASSRASEPTTETARPPTVDLYLAPMFSLVPITPQILTINGILYKLETGPGIQVSIPQTPSQTQAPRVPLRQRLAALNPGFTLDIFWIVAKLSFAVYFLSRGASTYRTAVLSISAFIVFLYQAGILGAEPARAPPQPQQQPAQNMAHPEPQPVDENLPVNENVQQHHQAQEPNLPAAQPRTLLGRVSFVALSFFASLIPGQPLPEHGLLQ